MEDGPAIPQCLTVKNSPIGTTRARKNKLFSSSFPRTSFRSY